MSSSDIIPARPTTATGDYADGYRRAVDSMGALRGGGMTDETLVTLAQQVGIIPARDAPASPPSTASTTWCTTSPADSEGKRER